jgi:pimeloyl-ACP methyl ester carboxylesterase
VTELSVARTGVRLSGDEDGEPGGTPVVLLHGLTATRRYVVMGSKALPRAGYRVIAYDARAHGASDPAPEPSAYEYADLVDDLAAVLDERGIERAVLAGASMGAHTLLRFALEHPERAAALVVITPAYDPTELDDPARNARWAALAQGLREDGIDGFVRAYGDGGVGPQWQETVQRVLRQRLAQHRHLDALADALDVTPLSRPFDRIEDLAAIEAPTTIVASNDEADPGHPFAIGQAYAAAIPGARLVTEEPGKSPIAWQGGQLSRVIEEAAARG